MKFKYIAEKFLNAKIKSFQTDSEGEFLSNNFRQFLETNGVMHRISCPYTQQQNSIAERKQRHLVETGLTLLTHSHLPCTHWLDTFQTTIYLINRLPTPVLTNKSPYQMLLNQNPDYSILKTLVCACYPLLRSHHNHKLQFRS